ncbi:MAG: DNA polymerase III subunit delta [Bacteroidia bacterium]
MKEVDKIILDIKRKIFSPVYFLCGDEPYFIDIISDLIENTALDEADKEFNQTVVYGKDTPLASIISLAKQFPMMSDKQVIIVKEAQDIKELSKKTTDDSKGGGDAVMQSFLHYLNAPLESTVLVFCYKYKKLDKRSVLYKTISKTATYLETKTLYDNEIPKWITNYVESKKHTINPKASFLIAEFLGNNLSKIANEVDKLFINLKEGTEISPEIVQENIGISKDFNVFELQNALGKKDILKSNRIINYFAANEKEHPTVMTLATLYGYFTKVMKVHALHDKSKMAAASALGVNPFFVQDYLSAAGYYSPNKLRNIFSYLKEYDLKSKGINNTGVNNGELLKEMVYKILHD